MAQTQEAMTQNLAERLCWQAARRDAARVARRLYRKQVVDGVYRLDEGAWLEPGVEDRLAAALLAEGYDAVATRFGEARLTASRALAGVSPATVATGVDLWTAAPVELPASPR